MTAPAAMQADFVDLKFVKGRKVMQVILELPIEAGAAFVAAFGTPNPSTGIPVALARIDVNAKPEKPKGGKLAQRAGILCSEGGFKKFIAEQMGVEFIDDVVAANFVREHCAVISRADLDHDKHAAVVFQNLVAEYNAWLAAS